MTSAGEEQPRKRIANYSPVEISLLKAVKDESSVEKEALELLKKTWTMNVTSAMKTTLGPEGLKKKK